MMLITSLILMRLTYKIIRNALLGKYCPQALLRHIFSLISIDMLTYKLSAKKWVKISKTPKNIRTFRVLHFQAGPLLPLKIPKV